MSTMQPIRNKQDIEKLKNYFLQKGEVRNYALVVFGMNVPIRISDILGLRWRNVFDFELQNFKKHIIVMESKTGKKNCLTLNKCVIEALFKLKDSELCKENDYIFKASIHSTTPLNRVSVYTIIKKAAHELELENIGCHSLRKTFGYHAWKQGVHLALIMSIYNHSSIQVTKRYLGIEQDDKDDVLNSMQL